MGDEGPAGESKAPKDKLKVEKLPLEDEVEDLPVGGEESGKIKGGAPPYVPVGMPRISNP
jgi:hypothetical protein